MKKWTVIGVYLDDHIWVEHVEAETPSKAVVAAVSANHAIAGILEVFEGHHYGRLGNLSIMWQEDLQKLREEEGVVCSGQPR